MFGFRLFWPDGSLRAEYWMNPADSRVNVVSYGVDGLPEQAGNATWDDFMTALANAKAAHA